MTSGHCGLLSRSALFINISYMGLNIKLSTCLYYIDFNYCFHAIESLNLMKQANIINIHERPMCDI